MLPTGPVWDKGRVLVTENGRVVARRERVLWGNIRASRAGIVIAGRWRAAGFTGGVVEVLEDGAQDPVLVSAAALGFRWERQ